MTYNLTFSLPLYLISKRNPRKADDPALLISTYQPQHWQYLCTQSRDSWFNQEDVKDSWLDHERGVCPGGGAYPPPPSQGDPPQPQSVFAGGSGLLTGDARLRPPLLI